MRMALGEGRAQLDSRGDELTGPRTGRGCAGTDAEHEPTARHPLDRGGSVGEQCRGTQHRIGDERAESDRRRGLCERTKCREALGRDVAADGVRREMVGDPHRGRAGRLGRLRYLDDLWPGGRTDVEMEVEDHPLIVPDGSPPHAVDWITGTAWSSCPVATTGRALSPRRHRASSRRRGRRRSADSHPRHRRSNGGRSPMQGPRRSDSCR